MNAFADQWVELPRYLAGHVQLTLISLAVGLAVSLPLGIAATRRPRLESAALGIASVMQTIPGLALLALMVPLLGFLGAAGAALGWPALPSIGFLPAVLALSLYSVLPMLRNTVTGISGVDPALCEAARGVGMSPREVLWQVELPLAMPTIVAGVRTATVWVVGTATLATPVGGTSLGNPIFAGLQTRNLSAVLVGSLAAAVLALCLDGLVRSIEVGLERRSRLRPVIALGVILLLAAWTVVAPMASGRAVTASSSTTEITLGSKPFTEQYILAEILAGLLSREPGVSIRRVPSLGSTVAFDALVAGDLDVYTDYTGTVWTTILGGGKDLAADREALLETVRTRLREEFGVSLIASLGFENTYVFAMREEDAAALGIRRVSDLATHAAGFEILGDFEFFERPEWKALQSRYALAFSNERAMDSSLMYEALRAGSGDVISAYSTDGRIAAYGLRVLEDDRGVIPPYDAIVLASRHFATGSPGLVEAIGLLEGRLDAASMRALNGAVDLDGKSPAAAAGEWIVRCLGAGPIRTPIGSCRASGADAP